MTDEITKPYPHRGVDAVYGHFGSISFAWDGGYHVYGGPQNYRHYKTYTGAWKAFCKINGYKLDVEVN